MKNDCIIRLERTEEHRETETLVREAFWNVYRIITAEKMVDSVIAAMGNIGGATQEMKDDLHKALMPFFLLAAKKR